jgi:two-component system, cell cycle response regulator DivK
MPPTSATVVLLVQADADSREMYAEFLRYNGFVTVLVSTAQVGLTVAPKADVIVTGLVLPGDMGGIEFIARLKREEHTKRIPVIVLTACAWNSDRERATKAGCDVFLAKPCFPDDLLRDVRRLHTASKRREISRVGTVYNTSPSLTQALPRHLNHQAQRRELSRPSVTSCAIRLAMRLNRTYHHFSPA